LARKILLADDSVTAQNMGRKILADAGYEVITVNNGSAALKKIAELKPDIVVLDVYMPGYSGLEVCQRVKESPETSRIPVLLTVGKLEPFKPEEARRVRAEGFIVKPFEASELLSALSKLEDKIVPRGEGAKTGRFARAIAAVEENSRYDKNAGGSEDSGWKTRIGFPVAKQVPEAEPAGPEIYNPMNRDLRTVVELKPQEAREEAVKEQAARVDLSALAAQGLPRDVSPEEIAALAAAAAHMKAKSAASAEPPVTEKIEDRKEDYSASVGAPAPSLQRSSFEKEVEADSLVPNAVDVLTAIENLERSSESGSGSPKPDPETASSQVNAEEAEPELATMAVGAGSAGSRAESRWMAIPVAMNAEESVISLDQEMQKAHAAFAETEVSAVFTPVVGENPEIASAPASGYEALTSDASNEVYEAPKSTPAVSAVNEPVTEPVAEQVSEMAHEATATVSSQPEPEPAPALVPEAEPAHPVAVEAAQTIESVGKEDYAAQSEDPQQAVTLEAGQDRNDREPSAEVAQNSPGAEELSSLAASEMLLPRVAEESSVAEVPTNELSASGTPSQQADVNVIPDEPLAGGREEMAKKESEVVATTAAAWANWRQIRESGDPKAPASEAAKPRYASLVEEKNAEPLDATAMAVAAGAENRPTDAATPEGESDDIASIVDSVLAQMRPKIVEEISRKMGKK
jgi:CheY-like chemotaxis protein